LPTRQRGNARPDNFIDAYNLAHRLKTLKEQWPSEAERFKIDPIHPMPGLDTRSS